MTGKIEWSVNMSDEDFASVAEPYFKKKFITLHEGICLVARVDPKSKTSPVGDGYEHWTEDDKTFPLDHTRRPFEVAIRAINGEEPGLELRTHKRPDHIQNGEQVLVNSRTFFRWVVAMWPATTPQIQFAEKLRNERKKANASASYLSAKSKTEIKHQHQQEAFKILVKDLGKKYTDCSDRQLSEMLAERIADKPYSAKWETLRKSIKLWRTHMV